jgi:hypothetical protein
MLSFRRICQWQTRWTLKLEIILSVVAMTIEKQEETISLGGDYIKLRWSEH